MSRLDPPPRSPGSAAPPPLTVQDLHEALQAGRIVPHFQPIVSMFCGRLRGFEVLARWHHPQHGQIAPAQFIPLARAHGLLAALTLALVRQACSAAVRWPGTFYLAFNMPPGLLVDTELVLDCLHVATECRFPLERLHVEMTEVEVVEDEAAAEVSIAQLRAFGIKTMLDDFGTGYSSLVRLHRFQFNKIKIDGGFIRTLEHDEASRKIVSAIVGLGKSLGADVVAECVESAFQRDFLISIDCDAYQGWLLAAAMDATETGRWLAGYTPQQNSSLGSRLSPYQRQYQLEILYERSPVGLAFIDPALRFVDANARFCQMMALQRSLIIGQPVADVVIPALHEQVLSMILKSLYEGLGDVCELTLPGSDDTYLLSHERVLDAAGAVLGVSVVCVDISESKRYQAALQLRERGDFGMSLDNPTVFWVAEASGRVSYLSPHVPEDDNCPLEQRIDRWYARMHPDDRVRVRLEWEARDPAVGTFQTRFRVLWGGQQWRWVVSRATLSGEGGNSRWYGLFTDISREVELERDLQHYQAQAGVLPAGTGIA